MVVTAAKVGAVKVPAGDVIEPAPVTTPRPPMVPIAGMLPMPAGNKTAPGPTIDAPTKLAPVMTPPAVTTPEACVAVNPAALLVVIRPAEVTPAGIAKAVVGVG